MGSVTGPAHLDIEIDEWQAAQEKPEAVSAHFTWRGAREDPVLDALFAGLPAGSGLVRINLLDGRTELAPGAWRGLRFGKGQPIYEAARGNFEAWSGGRSFLEEARRSEVGRMIRRLVPDFDDYTDKEQVDFIVRTQDKIDAVKQSADDLADHLEYAGLGTSRAVPPRKKPALKVRAAVFSDILRSTRRAGELLGIPHKDKVARYENQRVRKMAKIGRDLLHDYYGKSEYEAKIERIQRYYGWWKWFSSIEDPKEQMYILLAEAHGTSAEVEKLRGDEDGFAEKLDEWVTVVEVCLEAQEMYRKCGDSDQGEEAGNKARRLWAEQTRIEDLDARFGTALAFSALDAPPPSIA